MVVGRVNLIVRHYFATVIPVSVRPISGKREDPRGEKEIRKNRRIREGEAMLTVCNTSSLVIDKLCDQIGGERIVVCFYVDFAAREEQSPINILGSLLKQLIHGLDNILREVFNAFQAQKRAIGGRALRLAEVVELFRIITLSRRTIICIDGLDECVLPGRLELLGSLRDILQKSPGTRLFLTGRPYIWSDVKRVLGETVAVKAITTCKVDIIRYLLTRLDNDPTPDEMDTRLKSAIMVRIIRNTSKILRLVSLLIEAILRETTIHSRRQRLDAMTDGSDLGVAYDTTLERIKSEGEERFKLVMTTLMWICHSERPLHMDELRHALAIEIGDSEFKVNNVCSIGTLLSCCQGLVIVDRKSSTLQLVHFTLHKYLCTHLRHFVGAHSAMAETCLTYLNSQQVKNLSANPSPNLQDTPFLNYASRHWGTHAKIELSDSAKTLALQLFNQYDGHISARLLLQQIWNRNYVEHNPGSVFTGLHCASFFGIAEVVDALIGTEGYDINQRDWVGVTPLIWAAMYGHQDVVELLLEREGIIADIPDRGSGRTALSWAAGNGHEGTMRLLLMREDVNPDKPDNRSQTPIR
ncbi:ankyrin [Choiromyces venosus 120613-1]|uniref:Ankyrin n=1 Tax=Choiromyces venosus 120613-1 TaxID=1336337 RepID=A0A3N4K2N1_9PEZI|nr:ankyrin [Choiromyces venosus 120613-1]